MEGAAGDKVKKAHQLFVWMATMAPICLDCGIWGAQTLLWL
jgi:hypothetical protein